MHKTSTNNIKLNKKDIERLKEAIIKIKEWAGDNLEEVILFGSYARGEQHKFSSIDILIVLNKSYKRFISRKAELERLLNESGAIPLIDPLIYTENELIDLINKMESFIVSVLKEGIVLWNGRDQIEIDSLQEGSLLKSRYSSSLPEIEEV